MTGRTQQALQAALDHAMAGLKELQAVLEGSDVRARLVHDDGRVEDITEKLLAENRRRVRECGDLAQLLTSKPYPGPADGPPSHA